MKTVIAIIMGLFSGFLIYIMAAMVFLNRTPSSLFIIITFFGGWILTSFVILRGVKTLSRVFSRGFLIGAAEWLLMIPVGMIFSGKSVSNTISMSGGSDAAAAGAVIGGGLFAFLSAGVAIFMALVCLIGFAVSYFLGREMKPEASTPTKKCPECAELIQAEARKCRYCGANLKNTDSAEMETESRTR